MTGFPLPEFVGNRLLAVSWTPDRPAPAWLDGLCRDFATIETNGLAVLCERADCLAVAGDRAAALGTREILSPDHPGPIDATRMLGLLPDTIEPRAPAVVLSRQDDRITGWTDRFGIGQLFWIEKDGVAALSTSSSLLGKLFERPLDRDALTGFALTGNFVGADTAFADVAKIPLGKRAILERGQVTFANAASPLAYRDQGESSLAEVTDAFVAAVRHMVDAFPDAELELSGGLDSRLILSALTPEQRRGRSAVTIGPPTSGDARVARDLAEREALAHRLVGTDGYTGYSADDYAAFIARIAEGYDHLANPLDKVAIVSAALSAGEPPRARFGGQNGEILRGFYYPAQPIERSPSIALADRLITWRIEVNDRVADELLEIDDFPVRAQRIRERLRTELLSGGEPLWWQALDRFYLTERMPRWVGSSAGNRLIDRTNLYPFFDPAFVSAAMRLPGAVKRESRAAYRMLTGIDPRLSAIALDNGVVPERTGNSGTTTLRNKVNKVTNLARKGFSRLVRKSKPVLGSTSSIELWYGLSLFKRLPVRELNATGLAQQIAVEALATGDRRFDRASLGWLILVASALRSGIWWVGAKAPRE